MCTTLLGSVSLITWRLIFGDSYCPTEWRPFSEITTNISNDLLAYKNWEPSSYGSPLVHLTPPLNAPDVSLPLSQGQEDDAIVHPSPEGKNDVCIGDIFGIAL